MGGMKGLSWFKRIELASLLLVSVGFVGELFGDWFSRPIRKHLDEAREQLELEEDTNRTKGSRAELIACLRSGPKGPMIVVPMTMDQESEAYAGQIREVLQEAEFEMRPVRGRHAAGFGAPSAYVVVSDSSHPPLHVVHVQSCFQAFGIELEAAANPKLVPDSSIVDMAANCGRKTNAAPLMKIDETMRQDIPETRGKNSNCFSERRTAKLFCQGKQHRTSLVVGKLASNVRTNQWFLCKGFGRQARSAALT